MTLLPILFAVLYTGTIWATGTTDVKNVIGPTMNPPIDFRSQIYFLPTTGVLYKSDYEITKPAKLFQTEKSSVSALLLDGSNVYFGEGLHDDVTSNLYAFDLIKEKLFFKLQLPGHIERAPLVTKNMIYVGIGPGGMVAIDKKTQKILWKKEKIEEGALHVDSTPVLHNGNLCFTSIYSFKGLVCLSEKNGDKTLVVPLKSNPKSEIQISGIYLFGMAMDADMASAKWEVPSQFYVIDLITKKKVAEKELRGFQFTKTTEVSSKERFVALSTGDLLILRLPELSINYVGEMSEPVASNPFFMNNFYCAISLMGKLACFKRLENKFELMKEQKLLQVVVGEIGYIRGKLYVPSRMGYIIL